MERPKRVFVSVPRDHNLSTSQRALKQAILNKLRNEGIEPQEFQVSGLPLRSPYTFQAVKDIMIRCHGALILAFARWRDQTEIRNGLAIPTVWNHFEGAFALALKKEILVITERDVSADGITWDGGGQLILRAPTEAGVDWLQNDDDAKRQIDAWIKAVKEIDDIFLGYSSKARNTALDIHRFLTSRGVSVKDWEIDFAPGGTILERDYLKRLKTA